jgi:hypothetical protein
MHANFQRFTESMPWDAPLADHPDWEEIERAADIVRNRPARTPEPVRYITAERTK